MNPPTPQPDPPDPLAEACRAALEAEQAALARMPNRSREELKAALLAFLRQLPDAPREQQEPFEHLLSGRPVTPQTPGPTA
jgi:hypothetical protein